MNISRDDLYRIILEEYAREQGLNEDKVDDLLAWIKGAEKPEWAEVDRPTPEPPEVPDPDVTQVRDLGPRASADETFPMGTPPRPSMGRDELVDTIGELIHGKDPEEVSEIFELVFGKLPGVEIGEPEEPETLYIPGAEGRPAAGFQLQELMLLIKEVMNESEWYDITAGETAPPHSTDVAEPQELVQRIQNAYHDLQDAFGELPDEIAQEMGRKNNIRSRNTHGHHRIPRGLPRINV